MLPPPVRRRADALVLPTPPPLLRHSRFFPSFRRNSLCKNSENPEPRENISYWHGKYPPFPRRRESSAKRARNAHIRAMPPAGGGANLWPSAFPSNRHEGARSARFIRWIPACAGMARWGHGSGGVGFIRWMPIGFLHGLESRNPAQKERGTRTFA